MRSLLLIGLVFSLIPLVFMKPHIGVLLWGWISYMNPHRLTFGLAYSLPFLDFVFLATMIGLLISKEPKRIPSTPVVWLLGGYLAWVTFTTVFSLNTDPDQSSWIQISWDKWVLFLKIQLFTFLSLILLTTKGRIMALVAIIALSIGFFGAKGGVFTILGGGENRVWGPPGSFFGDNNHLALALITAAPLAWFFAMHAPHRLLRLGALVLVPLILIAALGTYSRGAVVGMSAMLLFLILRSRHRFLSLGVAALIGVLALMFMPQQWHERISTIQEYEEDMSAQQRLSAWRYAFAVANSRPIGGGFTVFYHQPTLDRFRAGDDKTHNAHSVYFEILGEHGYFGLFLFFWLATTAFFTASKVMRLARGRPDLLWARDLAALAQVSMVGFGTSGAFLNLGTFDLYYHVIAIIVIVHQVVVKQLAAEPQAQAAKAQPAGGLSQAPPPTRGSLAK